MLLRHGPLLLLLWLASAQSATLATLFQAQSTEEVDPDPADIAPVPSTEVPVEEALNTTAAEVLADRPEVEAQRVEAQRAEAEAQQAEAQRAEAEAQQAEAHQVEAQQAEAEAQRVEVQRAEAEAQQAEAQQAESEDTQDSTDAQEPLTDAVVADHGVAAELPETETQQVEEPAEQSLPPATETATDSPADSDAPTVASQEALGSSASMQETFPEWSEGPVNTELQTGEAVEESGWGLSAVRSSFQAINGYFDSMVELVGGRNGVCQYRCRHGSLPEPRPGYQLPEPNGCSSSLVGMQFDLGIPAMTACCDKLDMCYDTCGASKSRCDSKFRWCLHSICKDLKTSLGFVSKVQACESAADTLYNTVWTLGCRPYMNSQRAACVCTEEEREEL
ncbi:Group XIIB secretory phospholipase A2-like protein [Merluccius polli]|uniref:Group XIIB secretory phospholipase A2-like protein n=1 Tax=Merluccius polli TaxID=89951 RepID=A0AA47MF68_MERPO|nr:Group XIIB secretory phospholipase A2-like protein [Merluccius polli]